MDEKTVTWDKSVEICKKYNASLVTIESIEKQFFLKIFGWLGTMFWTSAHKDLNGKWKWINGNDILYTNWGEGEPNNQGGNQNCIRVWDAVSNGTWKWDDTNCDGVFVVCEFSFNV